jgi:hypothetical protein
MASINFPAIKALYGLLSLICVLVSNKGETTRFSRSAISGDENVDHFSIPIK